MASLSDESQTAVESIRRIQLHLQGARQWDAYEVLKNTVAKFADDPLHISYYGYLKAVLEGKYRSGIEDCMRAINLFQKKLWQGDGDVRTAQKAVLYLNLGKAYYAAGRRKDAIDTFHKGLQFDSQNRDLQATLKKVGVRKLVPIPFLDRNNPLNTFVGRMLRKNASPPSLL